LAIGAAGLKDVGRVDVGAPAPYPDIVDCTPGIVDCALRVGARFDPMLDKFGCINLSMPGAAGLKSVGRVDVGAPAPYCVSVGAVVLNALVEPTSLASMSIPVRGVPPDEDITLFNGSTPVLYPCALA
jgi:hypothetical protein